MFEELNTKVIPEYRFHDKRRWRFDYALPEYKIAIEQEGAIWTQGRHTRGSGFAKDMDKYNTATSMGWSILRFTPTQLKKEYLECLRIIEETIKTKIKNYKWLTLM